MSDSREFDWTDEETVLVREQLTLAVYVNPYGQVVLRRERTLDEDDDTFIVISSEFVPQVARALMSAASHEVEFEPGAKLAQGENGKSRDKTAAERQRRYRKRKRNGDGVTPVTPVTRNAETVTENNELQLVAAE